MAATSNKRRRSVGVDAEQPHARSDHSNRGAIDVALFGRRVGAMRERVSSLFRNAQYGASPDLLTQAFDELQLALEELQAAEEALRSQSQQQLNTHENLDTERRYYCDLFEQAPVAYLITSTEGTIRQANRPATALLRTQARQLIGRSLALFVPEGSRRVFRARLGQLCQSEGPHEWYTQIQPWEGEQRDVLLLVGAAFDSSGRPAALRWLVHELAAPAQLAAGTVISFEREQRLAQLNGQLVELRAQIQALARYADEATLEEREFGG